MAGNTARKPPVLTWFGADSANTLQIDCSPALLTWNAAAGRSYDVLSATNAAGTFQLRAAVIPTNSTGQWLETNAIPAQQFYRVRVGTSVHSVCNEKDPVSAAFRVLLIWPALSWLLQKPKRKTRWCGTGNRTGLMLTSNPGTCATSSNTWPPPPAGRSFSILARFTRSRSNSKTCPAAKPFI